MGLEENKKEDKEKEQNDFEAKIKALETLLYEERIKVEGLQTMINVAEQEFNIRIRKKSGTKQ